MLLCMHASTCCCALQRHTTSCMLYTNLCLGLHPGTTCKQAITEPRTQPPHHLPIPHNTPPSHAAPTVTRCTHRHTLHPPSHAAPTVTHCTHRQPPCPYPTSCLAHFLLLPAAGPTSVRRADCPGQKSSNPSSCQAGAHGGWFDAQGQGVANDYCRYVGSSTLSPQGWFSCALAGTPVGSCSDTLPGAYRQNPSNTSTIINPHPYDPDESCINNGCPAFSQDMCGWTEPRSYAINWVYPFNNPEASQYNYLYVCMQALSSCVAAGRLYCRLYFILAVVFYLQGGRQWLLYVHLHAGRQLLLPGFCRCCPLSYLE